MNLNKISRRNFLCAVGLTTAAALTACGSSASGRPHPLPPLPPEPLQNRWSSSSLPPPPSLRP